MTSSSSSPAVVRDLDGTVVRTPSPGADLRSGTWTRLGDTGVLGDRATESALHELAQSARAAAHAQGYATGWAEGRRAAEEQARVDAEQAAAEHAAEHARRAAEHERHVAALRAAAPLLQSTVA
jgi:flagellar assembly protein FliH